MIEDAHEPPQHILTIKIIFLVVVIVCSFASSTGFCFTVALEDEGTADVKVWAAQHEQEGSTSHSFDER